MKTILLFGCSLMLMATSGCLVSDGGERHEHWHHGGRSAVIVGPPAVVIPVPVIIVH